ncbi:hypothetical protein GQ53DRAFT_877000 [Thozetella sp. PMI_491]|nr:hypothetical protein GQ53DRAFT_877000 [Thozetella sp. PMI_491]
MSHSFSGGGFVGEQGLQSFVNVAPDNDVNSQNDFPRMRSRWTPKYQFRSTVGDNGKMVITIVGNITLKTMPADGKFGSKMTVSKLVIDADQNVQVTVVPVLDEPARSHDVVGSAASPSPELHSSTSISAYDDPFGPVTNKKGKLTETYCGNRGPKAGGRALSFTEACLQADAEKRALNPLALEFVPVTTGCATKPSVGLSGLSSVSAAVSSTYEGNPTLRRLSQAAAKPVNVDYTTGSQSFREHYLGMYGALQPPNAAATEKGQENLYLREIDFESPNKGVKQGRGFFAKSSSPGEGHDNKAVGDGFCHLLKAERMLGQKIIPHPKATKNTQPAMPGTQLADTAISATSSSDTTGSDITPNSI